MTEKLLSVSFLSIIPCYNNVLSLVKRKEIIWIFVVQAKKQETIKRVLEFIFKNYARALE